MRPPSGAAVSFEAISIAWFYVKNDLGSFVGGTAIILGILYGINLPISFGVNYMVYGSMGPAGQFELNKVLETVLLPLPLYALTQGLLAVFQVGMMEVFYRKQMGEQAVFGDFFAGFRKFGPVFVAGTISYVLTLLGTCLLIIPALYLQGALAFAPMIAFKQEVGGVEAVKRSMNTLKGSHAWSMFGLLFVSSLLVGLGACACGVGLLFTFPLLWGSVAVNYYNFFPPVQPQHFETPLGPPQFV